MESRGRRIAELVAGAVALAVVVHVASAGDEPKTARYYRQQAAAAYRAKDYATAIGNLEKALGLIPDHPTLFYNLAAVSALQGKKTESLAFLSRVVSSIHKRKILHVSKSGKVTTLASEQDGLWSVLGMKVDPARRVLWVTSTAFPQMVNFRKQEEGSSAVFKFDLKGGRLIKRYLVPDTSKPHALGDLTIESNGNVFCTDSLTPAVYVIRPKKDEIELLLENEGFVSPQGLAFSSDERHLFMADYSTGLFDIDVTTGTVTHLPPLPGATLLGIDGLYF